MYAVVFNSNYGYEVEVNLFEEITEAKEFLKEDWKRYLDIEIKESVIPVAEGFCYCDEEFAKVQWANDDMAYWTICEAKKPISECY